MHKANVIGFVIAVVVATLVCAESVHAQKQPTAAQAQLDSILAQIDAVNRYSDSYTANIKIASYSPDGPPVISAYRLFSKGLRKSLLIYLEPAKDAGKKIAQNGDSLWFYFPRAKQSMLIRPMNTLTGSIAVGDLIGEPVLELYDLEASSEASDGGIIMIFKAKGSSSPYGKIEYEYRSGAIAMQRCYTRSGILLKIIDYIDYAAGPGGRYATKIKIRNAVYPEYYALMQIADLKKADSIPDYYFTPEGLADAGKPAN